MNYLFLLIVFMPGYAHDAAYFDRPELCHAAMDVMKLEMPNREMACVPTYQEKSDVRDNWDQPYRKASGI